MEEMNVPGSLECDSMPPFMKLTDVVCKFQTYLSLFYLECCFYFLLGSFLSFLLLQVWIWSGPVPPVCAGLISTYRALQTGSTGRESQRCSLLWARGQFPCLSAPHFPHL